MSRILYTHGSMPDIESPPIGHSQSASGLSFTHDNSVKRKSEKPTDTYADKHFSTGFFHRIIHLEKLIKRQLALKSAAASAECTLFMGRAERSPLDKKY